MDLTYPELSLATLRTLENPQQNDDDEWMPARTRNYAGAWVTQWTIEGYAAVWRGLNLIAGDVAKLPIFTYRSTPNGRVEDRTHPAWHLLRHRVNQLLTPYQWLYVSAVDVILRGNAYALLIIEGGRPVEMVRLEPASVQPPAKPGEPYKYTSQVGTIPIPFDEILHVRRYTRDGIKGIGLLDVAAETLGLGLAARNYGANMLGSGAVPPFAIKDPMPLQGEALARARKDLQEAWGGWRKSTSPLLLTGNRDIAQLGVTPAEMQLLELRRFELIEIANFLGVPPHLLGDTNATSFKSLEQEAENYLTHSLDPWLVCFESEFRYKLMSPQERESESHTIEYKREALIRADSAARAELFKSLISNSIAAPNELRETMNMPRIEGLDKPLIPLNMAPVGERPDTEPAAGSNPPTGRDGPAATLARDSLRRLACRVAGRVSKLVESSKNAVTWLETQLDHEFHDLAVEMGVPAAEILQLSPADPAAILGRMRRELLECLGGDKSTALRSLEQWPKSFGRAN